MGRRKKFGRPVHGVLVLNKSPGMTSNKALQQVKWLFAAQKAGHTGSLDPQATGVLPICFGEATKFSQYLLDSDKGYRSTFLLGRATDTLDAEGAVTWECDASAIDGDTVRQALEQFKGDITQTPPMVSALKHQGRPLYEWARRGEEVARESRRVRIHRLQVLDIRLGPTVEVDVEVVCTKGTYIRSIADDLGRHLGVGGHVQSLHRFSVGAFHERDAVTLDELAQERDDRAAEVLDHHLKPVDASLETLPKLEIDPDSGHYFCHGQAIMDLRVYRLGQQGDTLRVCQKDGPFLGLGEITDDGRIAPRRVVVM